MKICETLMTTTTTSLLFLKRFWEDGDQPSSLAQIPPWGNKRTKADVWGKAHLGSKVLLSKPTGERQGGGETREGSEGRTRELKAGKTRLFLQPGQRTRFHCIRRSPDSGRTKVQ